MKFVRVQYEDRDASGEVTTRWHHRCADLPAALRALEDVGARIARGEEGWENVRAFIEGTDYAVPSPQSKEKETPTMASKKPQQLDIRDHASEEDLDDTPKGRNREIPGTERKVHRDVKLAAARYVEARDERMRLNRIELEKKAILLDRMKQHGITVHEDDELRVEITSSKENVKVRRLDEEDDGEE